jgi:hypothetical protein
MFHKVAEPLAYLARRLDTDGAVTPDDVARVTDAMLEAGNESFDNDPAFAPFVNPVLNTMREQQLRAFQDAGALRVPLIKGEGIPAVPNEHSDGKER